MVRAGRASIAGCDIAIAATKGDSALPVRSKTKTIWVLAVVRGPRSSC